ncbi:hypothetical protein [Helicobacter pylori]|nr:hypothetical protein [Helicobacter pylori]WQX59185.1 hypothetical protein KVJ99_06925 [Helicobacter pylori]WQX59750.1 hypothetical protein KVJ99_02175 [Helicobacter pylori]
MKEMNESYLEMIGNDGGAIGIKGVENKALKIKRIIKLNASLDKTHH